jgi:hypothetical protein
VFHSDLCGDAVDEPIETPEELVFTAEVEARLQLGGEAGVVRADARVEVGEEALAPGFAAEAAASNNRIPGRGALGVPADIRAARVRTSSCSSSPSGRSAPQSSAGAHGLLRGELGRLHTGRA